LSLLGAWGHVEIKALCANYFACVVVEAFPDDDDIAYVALHGDDPMAGAEGFVGSADVIERGRDVWVVVGVLVGQHKFGGEGDGAGVVSVDLFDLG
jgi:hypothetical protein